MPFKVKYCIFQEGMPAPYMTTFDYTMARVEWGGRTQDMKKGIPRLQQTVELTGETTPAERYLFLVYEVRHLQRKYFNGGRDKEVFKQALEKERELDLWNSRNRFHLQGHPKFTPSDQKAFAFFEVVEEWRKLWKEYFAYKKQRDADPAVVKERSKQCRDFEKTIDQYIKHEIKLL